MTDAVIAQADGPAVPIRLAAASEVESVLAALPAAQRAQAQIAGFRGKAGEVAT